MLSAVMSVWANDHPHLFDLALNSILLQTLKPTELVLVVDGPIDDSLEEVVLKYVALYSTRNINFIVHRFKINKGHGNARRAALRHASNDYVAICDADDISMAERFERLYEIIKNDKNLAVIGSFIEETDLINQSGFQSVRKVPTTNIEIYSYARYRCPFNQMSVILNKPLVESVGGYQDFYHNEDYYLWFRLMQQEYSLRNIDEVLVVAHQNTDSFRRRGGFAYFLSEVKIKRLFLAAGKINHFEFLCQVFVRIVVQLLLPSSLRKYIFLMFFRK